MKNVNAEWQDLQQKHGERQPPPFMREWAKVLGNNLPHKSKSRFPKTDGFSHSNLDCHTLPFPCNNQINQLLAVINDWVNKTRKVVDNLMGSLPLTFGSSPLDQGFNILPTLTLKNHDPISLLLH